MSGETDRKRAELELSELTDALEEAREAMHAAREGGTDTEKFAEANAAYNEASDKVAAARSALRAAYPPAGSNEGDDASPAVDTVRVKGLVNE